MLYQIQQTILSNLRNKLDVMVYDYVPLSPALPYVKLVTELCRDWSSVKHAGLYLKLGCEVYDDIDELQDSINILDTIKEVICNTKVALTNYNVINIVFNHYSTKQVYRQTYSIIYFDVFVREKNIR